MIVKSQYESSLQSKLKKNNSKIIEIKDNRDSELLKNVIDNFGIDALFVNTKRGIEGALKEQLGSCYSILMISENYFRLRRDIRDPNELTKLVKQFVNELIIGLTSEGCETAIIYRANDLSPLVPDKENNPLNEEFWRLLTTDLRSTGYTIIFVREDVDQQPDVLSCYADVVVSMTSAPQLWNDL